MGVYTTNPRVIHETIDGETIIIDLVSGTYYSLQGSGPEIWNRLQAGESVDVIVERLSKRYEGDRNDVQTGVEAFLGTLEQEQLVAKLEESRPLETAVSYDDPADRAYAAPNLEKYTDMQDIILLDPVHQVDDRGWPHAQVS